MPEPRSTMISARLPASVKEALRAAAEREHRTMANKSRGDDSGLV